MKDVLKEESEKSVIGKLLKQDKGYSLIINNVEVAIYNGQRQERPLYSLLKKNCDEIFGITDVEELSKIAFPCDYNCQGDELDYFERMAWVRGFNKSIELNKKLFTEKQVRMAIEIAWSNDHLNKIDIIKTIQEPTEIEVEIEMDIAMDGHTVLGYELDENGCLILKKK